MMTPESPERRSQQTTLIAPEGIVVATDLGDSDHLLPHVIAQATASSAHVTLVHAIVPADLAPVEAGAVLTVDPARIDRDVRMALLGIASGLQARGVSCSVVSKHGFAAEVIREQIDRTGATRLVIGTHGRGKLRRFALGSVAHELIGSIDVPVFAVGPHVRDAANCATPRKLLHPISFIGDYRKSVNFAIDLAKAYGAELILLHVLNPAAAYTGDRERTLAWTEDPLAAFTSDARELLPRIEMSLATGGVVEEILNTAAHRHPDWIILGVGGGIPNWPFRDSKAYKVLASADCPVLTIRHDPHLPIVETEAEIGSARRITGKSGVDSK